MARKVRVEYEAAIYHLVLLGECGIPKDSPSSRREFGKQMEARCWEEFPEEWKKIRRGWYLRDKKFRKELL